MGKPQKVETKLKKAIYERGFTAIEIGRIIKYRAIYNFMNGATKPSSKWLKKIAEALEMSFVELVREIRED